MESITYHLDSMCIDENIDTHHKQKIEHIDKIIEYLCHITHLNELYERAFEIMTSVKCYNINSCDRVDFCNDTYNKPVKIIILLCLYTFNIGTTYVYEIYDDICKMFINDDMCDTEILDIIENYELLKNVEDDYAI